MSLLQIRIDESLKKEAAEIMERLGLDLSSSVRMFLRKTVEEQRIPFPIECSSCDTTYVADEPPAIYGRQTNSRVDQYMDLLSPLSKEDKLTLIARLSNSLVGQKHRLEMDVAQRMFDKNWGGPESAESIARKLRKTRKNSKKKIDW